MSGNASSAWYADFFTELPNEFWRRAVPPEATSAEVDFIERQLGLAPGSRILDVPCGSGRHALALAERGHRVVGLDLSEEAIAHARALARPGDGIEFAVAEMRDVPRDGSFDAAICLGNSLGYLDLDGLAEFLAALAAALVRGGGIVLESGVTAESILPGFTGEGWSMQVGDIDASATTAYDVETSRLTSDYTFTRGVETTRGSAVYHVVTSGGLGRMLDEAGFTDVVRYGGPDRAPFVLGSPRLWLAARRA